MASYTRRVVVTETVEYTITSGEAIAELGKAYAAAEMDYRRRHKMAPYDQICDDWAHVHARDDEVVIAYVVPVEASDG